jgi:hypothetical protein
LKKLREIEVAELKRAEELDRIRQVKEAEERLKVREVALRKELERIKEVYQTSIKLWIETSK